MGTVAFIWLARSLVLGACVYSWYCNGTFGYMNSAPSEAKLFSQEFFRGLVGATVFVLFDMFKSIILIFVPYAQKRKSFGGLVGIRVYYVLATVLSLSSTAGLYLADRDSRASGSDAEKKAYDLAVNKVESILGDIRKIGKTRPLGKIDGDIRSLYSHPSWGSTNQCDPGVEKKLKNGRKIMWISSAASKKFCDRYATLIGEKQVVQTLTKLKMDLAEAEKKRDSFNLTEVLKKSDAQAELLGAALQVDREVIWIALGAIVSLLLEFMSGYGFALIGSLEDPQNQVLKQKVAGLEDQVKTKSVEVKAARKSLQLTKQFSDDPTGLQRFLQACTVQNPKADDFETSADLSSAYREFIKDKTVLEPLNSTTLPRALSKQGILRGRDTRAPGQPRGFRGIRLIKRPTQSVRSPDKSNVVKMVEKKMA